jgi:hypothetical protein
MQIIIVQLLTIYYAWIKIFDILFLLYELYLYLNFEFLLNIIIIFQI